MQAVMTPVDETPSGGEPSVLAIVPARGGSKSLPRKNVLDLAGRPLIAWSIAAAHDARCITRTIVSTDDDEIIAAARNVGAEVPFRRPDHLASDTASSLDVVLHALDALDEVYDYVVLLQPTSPLRLPSHIDAAYDLLRARAAPSCVSVCEAEASPYLMVRFEGEDRVAPVVELDGDLRRQSLPSVYQLNGAVYIVTPDELRTERRFVTRRTVGLVMPRTLSIDIDSVLDLECARTYLEKGPIDRERPPGT